MAIKKFNTQQDWDSAQKSTTESTVGLVVAGNTVEYNGVNVHTTQPEDGDILMYDSVANKYVALKRGTVNKSLLPNTYELRGYLFDRRGDVMKVLHPVETGGVKYADVVQFELNAPTLDGEEHTASIGVRVSGGTSAGYTDTTIINYSYTATTLAEVVTALNAAIDAAQNELGFTNVLWAYLNDDETKIIVQFDNWVDYRQYICAGMTHITWGDMPESDWYLKATGAYTQTRGIMNVAVGLAYWSTNGRTPTDDVPVALVGNDNPVLRACFDDPENAAYGYCAALRAAYGTYEQYIAIEFGIMRPQKFGCFGLPDCWTLSERYANLEAPTKVGGTKYKFPAMHSGAEKGFVDADFAVGKWALMGVDEGVYLLADEILAIIRDAQSRMGTTQMTNSAHRWFCQRNYVYLAWLFHGGYRNLYNNYVNYAIIAQAVSLLNISKL